MKKISFTKILTVVLVCAALIGAVVGINASAADEKSVEIVSNNVWYGDTLRLAYAVKSDADVEVTVYLDEACKVEWCKATEAEDTVTINGVECKKFYSNKGVPVQNMNTYLYAKAVNLENGDEDVQRYSVLEYLYERLNVSKNVSESQEKLYNAQLAYAKAAEKVLYEDSDEVERPDYTNPVEGYNYVRVNNVTIDGVYSAGVYANDSTPFEGGKMTYYIDGEQPENTELKWVIGGSSLTSDELKAVVADRTIIVEAIYEEIVASGQEVNATLTFDNTSKRTNLSTASQTWVENGITFTNNKGGGSNIADYCNPVRLYKSSNVEIKVEGNISTIAITCNSTTYANALANSTFDGGTVSVNGKVVTVTFDEGTEISALNITSLSAQVRVDSIFVKYITTK